MDDVLISRAAVAKAIADLGNEFLEGGSPTAVKVLNIAADRINALTPSPSAHVAGLREAIAEGMRIATVVPVEQVPDAINAFLARAAEREGGSHD